jgi:hypothetical protein
MERRVDGLSTMRIDMMDVAWARIHDVWICLDRSEEGPDRKNLPGTVDIYW